MPSHHVAQGSPSLLVLRVLEGGSLHGYAIAQRIRRLWGEMLEAKDGSLYPALQRMLVEGRVTAAWGVSETNRRVRFYTLTRDGRRQVKREIEQYEQISAAIRSILCA
jgi:PadR family transcriptional regulator, regulatory protein PadR